MNIILILLVFIVLITIVVVSDCNKKDKIDNFESITKSREVEGFANVDEAIKNVASVYNKDNMAVT